jgi:hypothetical protein
MVDNHDGTDFCVPEGACDRTAMGGGRGLTAGCVSVSTDLTLAALTAALDSVIEPSDCSSNIRLRSAAVGFTLGTEGAEGAAGTVGAGAAD